VVEHPICKDEALSSNPSTSKRQREKEREREREREENVLKQSPAK
jgi:hypothetical protein